MSFRPRRAASPPSGEILRVCVSEDKLFFRRVLPYFTVQDKIPRLTLGMTERENGCSASFSVTLSSSSHAYAVSILPMAKCSTCKAAPPLPKNLAALRVSGALFYEPRSRTGLFFHKENPLPPPTKKTGGAPAFSKILFKKRGNVRLLRLGLLPAHDEQTDRQHDHAHRDAH